MTLRIRSRQLLRQLAQSVSIVAAPLAALVFGGAAVAEGGVSSGWHSNYNSRARLLAGNDAARRPASILAAVEIETRSDWKTYWINPGDAGVPPSFDWSKSHNLKAVKVHYPAPYRFEDKAGTTFGYLGGVAFPVTVTPEDPAKPVTLRVAIEYGICKDICVPAQAELAVEIAPAPAHLAPAALVEASARLPRQRGQEQADDPVIEAIDITSTGEQPRIVLKVKAAGPTELQDAFLVAEDGSFMPLPVREAGDAPDRVRFVVDLTKDVDVADLKGKGILAVVTGPRGASETRFRID